MSIHVLQELKTDLHVSSYMLVIMRYKRLKVTLMQEIKSI